MAITTVTLANGFVSHLRYIEPTRTKMERLLTQGVIVRRDIEQIYKGLYLEAFCAFEVFIESLFIGLLVGKLIHTSPIVIPRVSFNSDIIARDIVFSGAKYVDWLPYHNTEKRAAAFFRNGLPFSSLNSNEKQLMDKLCYIRNALAHKSNHAKRVFENNVIGATPVTPREIKPEGFLRGIFRVAPTQTRYENLVIEMANIASKLCM